MDVHQMNPLKIPEIARQVVEHLAQSQKSMRHQLLSLSLVAKIFYEPSMDALWKRMRSLQPLFALIPAHYNTEQQQWVVMGSLSDDACPTFHIHRCRIQELVLCKEARVNIEVFTLSRILRLPRGFLPRLQTITIDLKGETVGVAQVAHISALLSSNNCQHFSLKSTLNKRKAVPFGSLLPVLREGGSHLLTLSLTCDIDGAHLGSLSWTSLARFTLTTQSRNITNSLFHALASLPSLRILSLSLLGPVKMSANHPAAFEHPSTFKNLFPCALPDLTHLSLSLPTYATRHILEIFPLRKLESLEITQVEKKDVPDKWIELTQQISLLSHISALSLANIDHPDITYPEFLKPLLELDLQQFSFASAEHGTAFIPGDIEDMARSWHGLTSFTLTQPPWAHSERLYLTLTSLEQFAKFCRNLRTLSVPIRHPYARPLHFDPTSPIPIVFAEDMHPVEDVRSPSPGIAELGEDVIPCPSLVRLDLSGSNLDHIANLARHIDYLFPNLEELLGNTDGDEDIELLRTSVLELCQPVRKQAERRFRVD